jgi:tRNA (guanine-N7-)-methyltransferase
MGRRALRKIDPSLDLTNHLKTLDQLPHPWNPDALFDRAAPPGDCPNFRLGENGTVPLAAGRIRPLEVEVGSGKGLFLRNAAAALPDVDFLGIEVAHKYAEFAAASLAKAGLQNAVMVHGDGLRLFHELIPDDSLAAVHVYFPDPWWKKRHRRRRVMRESFLRDVERTLRPGGSLHFWTDVEEYFQTSLELLAAQTTLLGPLPVPETPAEHDMAYRTHFERRMRLASEPVYRSEFKKK